MFQSIRLRPERFADRLTQMGLPFTRSLGISNNSQRSPGFRRPLLLFTKPVLP
jgi:hypothetical protein